MQTPLLAPLHRRLLQSACIASLLLILFGGALIPFLFESQTMFYKFGQDKILLRIGKIAGISAAILLLAQPLLTGRSRWVDRVAGLPTLVQLHRANGILILLLLLSHVLCILVPEGIDNLPLGWKFWPELVGGVVFASLLCLVPFSLLRKRLAVPYHLWLRMHRYGGFALLVLLFIHIRFVSESFKQDVPLAALTLWTIVAACLLIRRIYAGRPTAYQWKVAHIAHHTRSLRTITLTSERKAPFAYLPGQFAFLSITDPHISREAHPFSLSSTPTNNHAVTMTIRSCGDWTEKLHHLQPGSDAALWGPFGQFSYLLHQAPELVFIAGGIGITPFMSMLRHMADNADQRPVLLVWTCRKKEDLIFHSELKQLEQSLPALRTFVHLTGETATDSRINEKHLAPLLQPVSVQAGIYLCGPPSMTASLRPLLIHLGYPINNIHSEAFAF